MFCSRLRSNFWTTRTLPLKFLGLLLAIFAFGTTMLGATSVPQTATIEASKIVEGDVYLRAKTVAIEGTVRGTAAIAARKITINGTVENDVYLAAETVAINGRVGGDAVIAGREVRLNGRVEGDASAIAQSAVVNGPVGGDVRLAGEVLLLEARAAVGEDVTAAGGSLETRVGSRIGRNLNFAGARALLAGTVNKNAIASVGAAALHGIFDGNVNMTVGNRPVWQMPFLPEPAIARPHVLPGLKVADSAQIGGNFTYRAPETAQLGKKAWIAGSTIREPLEVAQPVAGAGLNPAESFWRQVQRFASLALVGGFFIGLKPEWARTLARTVRQRPGESLGWGAIAILAVGGMAIAIVVVATLLAFLFGFTLRGLMLPVLGLGMLANVALLVAFGLFIGFIPPIVLSYGGGRALLHNFKPEWALRDGIALCIGLVGFVAIAAIPVVGTIFSAIAICLGLGALCLCARRWQQRHRRDRLKARPTFNAERSEQAMAPDSITLR